MAIALRFLSVATFLFLLISSADASSGVHDLLEKFGFPKGLLPSSAKNYSLADDGSFEIQLEHPCDAQFSDFVHYDEIITGSISYGSLSGINGIHVRKFFLWHPISSIRVDENAKTIRITMGLLSEVHPWNEFKDVRDCVNQLRKASYRRAATPTSYLKNYS